MNSYTINQLRRDPQTGYYDLTQKTVSNSTQIRTIPYTVKPEQEMRLDKISAEVYSTTEYTEEIMALNGILNQFNVKAGDVINLFYFEDLNQLEWNEPQKNPNQKSLSNPSKNTQQDQNRLSPTENPGIKPVILDTKSKKIKIMDKLS